MTADEYGRLVGRFGRADPSELERIATDAEALAATAPSTSLRVNATALAAASRALTGRDVDVAVITDASPPSADGNAVERARQLLGGTGTLADGIAEHEVATAVPRATLESAAASLVRALRDRAAEDLGIDDAEPEVRVRDGLAGGARAVLGADRERLRIDLDGSRPWPVYRLVTTVAALGYPGRYVVRRMRPCEPQWFPSPTLTVDAGLAAVGREVLMGEHELARELERIGRRAGARWDADRIMAVGRARAELRPSYGDLAVRSPGEDVMAAVEALGTPASRAATLVRAWRRPLARAATVARAAGPEIVREWLVTVGQTDGLARLLARAHVPTELREEASRGP